MEDAAVEFLLENLKHIQLYQSHLISDHVKIHIETLEKNLCLFKGFLKCSTEKRDKKDESRLRELVRQILEVVYQAEDAVDALISQAADKELVKYFERAFDAESMLLSVVQQVEAIAAEVKERYDLNRIDSAALQTEAAYGTRVERKNLRQNKVMPQREEKVVGLEDEAEMLRNYLMEEAEKLDVFSIVGMGGLGKTTLARKIFRDPKIQYEFPIRLWVYLSAQYNIKDIFLGILRDLSWITEDMYDKTIEEIAHTVHTSLEREKFLIVLDDMWTTNAWDELKYAIPMSNRLSKVLITTRMMDVCAYASHVRVPYLLRFLTEEESWSLLELTVFGEDKCPPYLIDLGKAISNKCQGLPLWLNVIGGILANRDSVGDMNSMKNLWKETCGRLATESWHSEPGNFLEVSYIMLPYCLRPCFLYLALFPEDFQISVQRLIQLWIAERFIQQKTGISLEDTAYEYLQELIDRKLVMLDRVSSIGRIKTCRVHDLIRDFCLAKADGYFFRDIVNSDKEVFHPSNSDLQKYRRISVLSDVVGFISSQPYSPYVRTFLHSSKEEIIVLPENVSSIPDAFKLLRVLDVKPILFTRFPFYLTQLFHLRFVTLSSNFKVLPEAISKMLNIQTLTIYTSSRTLKIKADIWMMTQLRHLQSNASITLDNSTGEAAGSKNTGETIQTIANISPQSCTQVFERATNIKKLGIRGRLVMLMDETGGSCLFNGLEKLDHLEILKLLNDVGEIPLPRLPQANKFPPKLTSMTLSYTFLGWKNLSILGMLENLKVLKLKNSAFMGERWEAVDQNGFNQLQVLQVEYSNLVVWEASNNHFPKLQYLKLRNCEQLQALPSSLENASSLQEIYLYRTNKSAAAAAKKICDAIEHSQGRRLVLSVFPRDDQP